MSNYYRITCRTCDKQMQYDGCNWGVDGQVSLLKHRQQVLVLYEIGWPLDIELRVHGVYADLDFVREHNEHELVVMSEYDDHYFDIEGVRHPPEEADDDNPTPS